MRNIVLENWIRNRKTYIQTELDNLKGEEVEYLIYLNQINLLKELEQFISYGAF